MTPMPHRRELRATGFAFGLSLILGLAGGLALAAPGATAQAYVDTELLDVLFAELRRSPDQESAQATATRIWQVWTQPDDPELAQSMQDAYDARRDGDYPATIAILDEVIERWPDYAEGWNQRATIYFFMENYDASLADVDETLLREPRHFGALVGAATIHLILGDRPTALGFMSRAIRYHPYLVERRYFPELLRLPAEA